MMLVRTLGTRRCRPTPRRVPSRRETHTRRQRQLYMQSQHISFCRLREKERETTKGRREAWRVVPLLLTMLIKRSCCEHSSYRCGTSANKCRRTRREQSLREPRQWLSKGRLRSRRNAERRFERAARAEKGKNCCEGRISNSFLILEHERPVLELAQADSARFGRGGSGKGECAGKEEEV